MFAFWGGGQTLDQVSFDLDSETMWAFFECFPSDVSYDPSTAADHYFKEDATDEFMAFLGDELNEFFAA